MRQKGNESEGEGTPSNWRCCCFLFFFGGGTFSGFVPSFPTEHQQEEQQETRTTRDLKPVAGKTKAPKWSSWSLHDPLKKWLVITQNNGVMDPFLKGHGDSRLIYSLKSRNSGSENSMTEVTVLLLFGRFRAQHCLRINVACVGSLPFAFVPAGQMRTYCPVVKSTPFKTNWGK